MSMKAIPPPAPAQLEVEEASVERQRLLDVADLEGDVVDARRGAGRRAHAGSVGRDTAQSARNLRRYAVLRIS